MKLSEFGINNPVKVLMIFIGIFVLGAVCFFILPIDLMPEIEPPAVSVITYYPGAGAKDVELKVTKEIENQLSIISNLDEISSTSKENLSMVTCKMKWSTNLDEASNDIRERLEFAKKRLPDDIEDPMIFKFNTSMFPVLVFAVTSDQSYENLHDIIEDRIVDVIKRIPGVGAAQIIGALKRQINIRLDKAKMGAYNISPAEIENILCAENITEPVGNIKIGRNNFVIRIPGEFETVKEIGDIVVKIYQNKLVYLKDVARIEDGFKEQKQLVNVNRNKKSLIFIVQKRSGANTLEISRKIKAKIKEIRPSLPEDIGIINVFDSSDQIILAINNLAGSVIWGGIFVILSVLFFLRRIRSSLIIALTIPFSLIIAFIFLFLFDFTINMMSLAALAIAMGMVVDNAVVVLENITKFYERKVKPKEGSILGASEVSSAIIASTSTTVVIFIPLLFLTGITGIIFKQLAVVIVLTITASLFVALTLTPVLCSKLLHIEKSDSDKKAGYLTRFYNFSEKIFLGIEQSYSRLLGGALHYKKTVVFVALIIFISSLYFLKFIGTEFMPEEDTGDLRINFQVAEGTKVEETYRIGMQILEFYYKFVPEKTNVYFRCGQSEQGMASAMGMKEGPNIGESGVKLVKQKYRNRSAKEISDILRKHIDKIPEITKISVTAGNPIGQLLFGGGKPLTLEIRGQDIDVAYDLALKIKKIFESVNGTGDVTVSLDMGRPELKVKINRSKAAFLGLNTYHISKTIRSYFYGRTATKYREKGEEYDIFLQLRDEDKSKIRDLSEVPLKTFSGQQIKLKEIAYITEGAGPVEIQRINQERVIKIEANVSSRTMGEIETDINKKLSNLIIPQGISLRWAGMVKEQKESFRDLFLLLLLGLLLVYMVMAGQFESLIYPFIIMFSVPFALSGVLLALFLTGNTISIISIIGLIMLVGIVVNNAIVLVDYINILRARGYDLANAVRTAGAARLRPVLITTITTILGLVPLATSTGEGHEVWGPLGWTVIGGLSVSTLVTLVLIPVIYSIVSRRIKKGKTVAVQR